MDKQTVIAIALTFFSITAPAAVSLYIMLHKILGILKTLKELSESMIEREERHYDKLEARIQRVEDTLNARHGQRHREVD